MWNKIQKLLAAVFTCLLLHDIYMYMCVMIVGAYHMCAQRTLATSCSLLCSKCGSGAPKIYMHNGGDSQVSEKRDLPGPFSNQN